MSVYKRIPGNINFEIMLNGKNRMILNHNKSLFVKNSIVRFGYYGITKVVKLDWLAMISWFEVDLPAELINRIWDIDFVKFKDSKLFRSISRRRMIIKKPILYMDKYRIIPNYPRYGVSIDGDIIDTKSNLLVKTVKKENDYYYVYVYDPEYRKILRSRKHILIALAWVDNDDYENKTVVNHKDGDKYNNAIDNLEWTTPSENNNHAINNNMRTDNIKCTVEDIVSKKIYKFNSIGQAKKIIGYTSLSIKQLSKLIDKGLLSNRYRLLLNGLTIDKYLESKTKSINKPCRVKTIKDSNGKITLYTSLRKASEVFDLDKKTIKRLATAKESYNGYTFTFYN